MTINYQGGRARDNQRQRLYDAEDALHGLRVSTPAKRHLIDTQTMSGTWMGKCPTTQAVQAYMDAVTGYAWFQRRWGSTRFRYVLGNGSHGGYYNVTVSQTHRRSEVVILHEMAHSLTGPDDAHHGPEFAGILLTLVHHTMGKAYADRLRASYKQHKVRYTKSAVPAPKRPVVTQAKQAAKVRQTAIQRKAAADRAVRLPVRRREAAATIRALVADGEFGEPGDPNRRRALATARKMEANA
jgi:putative metallohydrolase (TIGR04338 family)